MFRYLNTMIHTKCSKEYHVERFVRDAKMIEVAEGTTEILKISIGRGVLAPKK